MTDEELDIFFIEELKKILADMKDCSEAAKKQTWEEYDEIKEDYAYVIDDLENLLETVHSIDDLALTSDEEITNVYEYLEAYRDYLPISAEPEEQKKNLQEYNNITEILDLFTDDEEDEDSDDMEDSDSEKD